MSERTYLTKQDDMIDWIAWRTYGYSVGSTEKIIERNRAIGLSEQTEELPPGLTIILPDIPRPTAPRMIRLWD